MMSFLQHFRTGGPPTSGSLIPKCGACGLHRECRSPKMEVSGAGRRKILLVGEAPGETEDREGRQFVGKTGRYLEAALSDLGVSMARDCWLTNSVICRPPANRLPDKAVDYCRPNLIKTVQDLKPEVIVLLGGAAVKSLIGWLWREDTGGVNRWAGFRVPCQRLNAWICPAWHPSYVVREEPGAKGRDEVKALLWRKQLAGALGLKGRPWDKVPDFTRDLKLVYDADAAAKAIESMTGSSPVAWDIETDRLKPDPADSRIVCCSLSDGTTTIAFPWHGRAVEAMREFLRSDTPKIGYNLKFESRWVQRHLKIRVRNWVWDGMLAAHTLDSRRAITGLKFQAFALLGQEDYDHEVKNFLKADGANLPNRIREVPLPKLLKYCALDALLEYKVAKIQAKQLGIKL